MTNIKTTKELLDLDIVELEQFLSDTLGSRVQFEEFLDPRLLSITEGWLQATKEDVRLQLEAVATDAEWRRKATSFRNLLSVRLKLVLARSPKDTDARRWRAFAHKILAAVDEQGDEATIDAIEGVECPFGDMNAWEWWERRLEKRGLLGEVAA